MMANGSNPDTDNRRVKALEMRLAGKSYRTIGVELGVSHVTAYEDVKIMLAEYCSETADDVRSQEVHRLDALMMAQWDAASAGDLKASELVLKIMGQRARLLGLEQTTVTMNVRQQRQLVDAEIARLAAALEVSEDEIRAEMEALNG